MLNVHRSLYRYQSVALDQAYLTKRIRDIASIRYGYRRIHTLLQREGWQVNHKRVYRLYCQENLQMRLKSPKRKVSIKIRREPVVATRKNECWSTDFVSDGLFDGRRLRALTIVDNFTRESPAIRVGCCCRGTDVVEEQEAATKLNGLPKVIKVDKRPRIYLEGARSMGL